jgi:transcriptional regulator GlxA family with amidase domain
VQALLAELARPGAEPPPVPELAARAGLGETAFRALVHELTGRSPRAHLENLRLERAARLLAESTQPVATIASEAGYADPFHFSRAFRRRFGTAPRAYRAKCSIQGAASTPVRRKA